MLVKTYQPLISRLDKLLGTPRRLVRLVYKEVVILLVVWSHC